MYMSDDSGNDTLQTPHDADTGDWIFYSQNRFTGKSVKINIQELIRDVQAITSKTYIIETQGYKKAQIAANLEAEEAATKQRWKDAYRANHPKATPAEVEAAILNRKVKWPKYIRDKIK